MRTLLLFLLLALPAAAAQSVTLAWNQNAETNLAGYKLYYGTASRSYTSNVVVTYPGTTATVTNIVAGKTNFFAATAVDVNGLESAFSDEVAWFAPPLPPAAPKGFRIVTTLQASTSQQGPWTNVWQLKQPLPPAKAGVAATYYRATSLIESE